MAFSAPNIEEFIQFADAGIRDTILAFVRHPFGFHGDTGLQNYLYYRLLTHAGSRAVWPPKFGPGESTLLLQVEHYTGLTYQRTGINPSPGRFDLAFVSGERLDMEGADLRADLLPAVIAIEIGRNKSASSILGHIDAVEQEHGPKPGDAAKVVRELKFGTLKMGYLLEFFDGSNGGHPANNVSMLADELSVYAEKIENLRIALVGFAPGIKPTVWFYPDDWGRLLCMNDWVVEILNKKMTIERPLQLFGLRKPVKQIRANKGQRGSESRTIPATFCERCSDGGQCLQKALQMQVGSFFRLHYGGQTMTINHRQLGCVARVSNTLYLQGEMIIPSHPNLRELLRQHLGDSMVNGGFQIPPESDEQFLLSVVSALKDIHRNGG